MLTQGTHLSCGDVMTSGVDKTNIGALLRKIIFTVLTHEP